jgi:hypothetical protein
MKWAVAIGGMADAIAVWEELLPPPFDPHAITLDRHTSWLPILHLTEWDSLSDPLDVRNAASAVIPALNGLVSAMRPDRFGLVHDHDVVELVDSTSVRIHSFHFDRADNWSVAHYGGAVVCPIVERPSPTPVQNPTFVQRAIEATSGHSLAALEYFYRGTTWSELWKAFEAVGAYYGSTSDRTYLKLGATVDDLADFRATANEHHRHHMWKGRPGGRRELDLFEGREFVAALIRAMFEQMLRTT